MDGWIHGWMDSWMGGFIDWRITGLAAGIHSISFRLPDFFARGLRQFSQISPRLRLGDVAVEGVEEVVFEVAFGLIVGDAEVAWTDAVRTQLLGEPEFGDGFAVAALEPGTIGGAGVERLDEVATEHSVLLGEDERNGDVQQQGGDGIGIAGARGKGQGGLASGLRPMTASEIGEDEERFPDVSSAIVEASGAFGSSGGDGVRVVGDELEALVADREGVEIAEALALFGGGFAFHAKDDAAISQGVGEMADGGENFGAPGRIMPQCRMGNAERGIGWKSGRWEIGAGSWKIGDGRRWMDDG